MPMRPERNEWSSHLQIAADPLNDGVATEKTGCVGLAN
jgi:hypothetical protein